MFRRLALLILFLLSVNKCVQSQDSVGWVPVTRGEYIDWDLESVPVEIKTDTTLGSNELVKLYEQVRLFFENAQNDDAGAVFIKFSSPPQYLVEYCTGWNDFPTTLPSATKKIWRITLDKSEGIRVKIHCNGVLVLNLRLSDDTCPGDYYAAEYIKYYEDEPLSWNSYYRRDVTKIALYSPRTDPSYYRPYTVNTATDSKTVRLYVPGLIITVAGLLSQASLQDALNEAQKENKLTFTFETGTDGNSLLESIDGDTVGAGQYWSMTVGGENQTLPINEFIPPNWVTVVFKKALSFAEADKGWIPVTHEDIDWDLESVPIEIKTYSTLGSDEGVYLGFKSAQYVYAGGFWIKFSSPPQYLIRSCSPWTNFPTTLPSTTEKIWRITLDKSEGIRVKIHCNGVLVLNLLLSDQVCTTFRPSWNPSWSEVWSGDVKQLYFSDSGRAPEYYRPYRATGTKTVRLYVPGVIVTVAGLLSQASLQDALNEAQKENKLTFAFETGIDGNPVLESINGDTVGAGQYWSMTVGGVSQTLPINEYIPPHWVTVVFKMALSSADADEGVPRYTITYSMWNDRYAKTRDSQFVKIKGSNGETEEYRCNANFDVINQDVRCVFQSPVNIGDYRCISLRTGGTDGIDFIKIKVEINGTEVHTIVPHGHATVMGLDNDETKEFCTAASERCREYLGCWRDAQDRAIETSVVYFRQNVMDNCHDLAAEKGYTVFGLEVGEECWTAANALKTYQKYERATGRPTCEPDGEGGQWSLDVYKIIPCPEN